MKHMPATLRAIFVIAGAALSVCLLAGSSLDRYLWSLPTWVPAPTVPANNPMSEAKVLLGRHLFYDKRLSADQSMACASCHLQEKAFTDGLSVSKGINGEMGTRSAMSLVNLAYMPVLTWANPNLTALEMQSLVPIFGEHPVEMGMAGKEKLLFERLQADPIYHRLFKDAFPNEAKRGQNDLYSLSTITKALASFERSLISFNSPYDRYMYGGDKEALSAAAVRGQELFFGEKLECYHCHGGFNFTDNIQHSKLPLSERGFHNTGLYNQDGRGAYPDKHSGLREHTGQADDEGKFRTPSLRNVELTAPYMHDGSIATLEQVIREHYALAGRSAKYPHGPSPMRSGFIAGFKVNEQEIQDIVAFLHSLTDTEFVKNPKHNNPWVNH